MSGQDLSGKVAIITGANTEVAEAVGLSLARAGVRISLCGRQQDVLELAAARITAAGGSCITLPSTLDDLQEAGVVVQRTLEAFGQVDILVMVSPFWAGGQVHEHSLATWDLVLRANLREPFVISRAVLPLFREQKHGQVMAIGSDSAEGIYQRDGAYGVAMHALTTLMELIREENAALGIRTHILSPGVALSDEIGSDGLPSLTTQDVAEWALWLLSRPAHLRGNGSLLL